MRSGALALLLAHGRPHFGLDLCAAELGRRALERDNGLPVDLIEV